MCAGDSSADRLKSQAISFPNISVQLLMRKATTTFTCTHKTTMGWKHIKQTFPFLILVVMCLFSHETPPQRFKGDSKVPLNRNALIGPKGLVNLVYLVFTRTYSGSCPWLSSEYLAQCIWQDYWNSSCWLKSFGWCGGAEKATACGGKDLL